MDFYNISRVSLASLDPYMNEYLKVMEKDKKERKEKEKREREERVYDDVTLREYFNDDLICEINVGILSPKALLADEEKRKKFFESMPLPSCALPYNMFYDLEFTENNKCCYCKNVLGYNNFLVAENEICIHKKCYLVLFPHKEQHDNADDNNKDHCNAEDNKDDNDENDENDIDDNDVKDENK